MSKAACHDSNHSDIKHRFAVLGKFLIASAVPTIQINAAEGAFYDPSFRQDFESLCSIASLDSF